MDRYVSRNKKNENPTTQIIIEKFLRLTTEYQTEIIKGTKEKK